MKAYWGSGGVTPHIFTSALAGGEKNIALIAHTSPKPVTLLTELPRLVMPP
jgi:hypothetical protein